LREAVARVLGTSPDKLDESDPITKMGLDSLMANQLRNWIQGNLNIDYSMMRIMRGPSLTELSEQLLEETAAEMDAEGAGADDEKSRWIKREKVIQTPRYRLFCLPYFGGGASAFNSWAANLPNDIEVCTIQLPGREERSNEAPFTDMNELIPELARIMEPLLDRPFAVYGHSLGAGIGYELLRYLRREKNLVPAHFFTASWPAPHIEGFVKTLGGKQENYAKLPEEEIIKKMRNFDLPGQVFANQERMKELMPGIKADMVIGVHYKHSADEPLANDITAVRGSKDRVYSREDMQAWEQYTSGKFDFRTIEGGTHIFINEKLKEVTALISEKLH